MSKKIVNKTPVRPVAKVKLDEKEPVVEASLNKKQFAELIERYKVQNPKKYEAKKEALEKQLNSLK